MLFFYAGSVSGQCPPNIDFEYNNFSFWQCWVGNHRINEDQTDTIDLGTSPVSPVPGRHSLLSSAITIPVDSFGLFPQQCPNGSGYSVKLGNDKGGHESDAISYTFTVPPGQNDFNLIYHYAFVFHDPGHVGGEQPGFIIKVENLTDGVKEDCATIDFVANQNTPGVKLSPLSTEWGPIWYKEWSANSLHLKNKAGKTFRIFFITSDCTYTDHFCYAYIDIDRNCTNSFEGAVFCPDDTEVNLTAPTGYETYRWFNDTYSQILGTNRQLTLVPPPANGSIFAVEITPKNGFGCKDTLRAAVFDTLSVMANAGTDVSTCNGTPVQIGSPPISGMRYSWSPTQGLSNPAIANPMASPSNTTPYTLTVTSGGRGCPVTDVVNVEAINVNQSLTSIGKEDHCVGTGPLPILRAGLTDGIQWYKDSVAISGATNRDYTVTQTGTYYAELTNNRCPSLFSTPLKKIRIDTAITGITYPEQQIAFNFPQKLKARNLGKEVLWTPSVNLNNPKSFTPEFKGFNPQLYYVQITNPNGCITTDTQNVTTFKKIAIYVPTVFSPNGDKLNDNLRPVLAGFVKVNYFRIFNRWGQLLFETKTDTPGWNGRINNQLQETQSVVWMIEAVDIDGKIHQKTGTTILFR